MLSKSLTTELYPQPAFLLSAFEKDLTELSVLAQFTVVPAGLELEFLLPLPPEWLG